MCWSAAVVNPPEAAGTLTSTPKATTRTLPDRVDWERIKTAGRLRRLALARDRSAHFRAYTASLALGELVGLDPLAPGPCATAVIYLHNNLLDLENAYPGESWAPLRRLVTTEPSIRACAPSHAR